MKILVLGITGRTGRLVAEEALKRGHKVVGIARDKTRVNLSGVEVIEGNAYDPETVRKAIEGCESVLSTLSLVAKSQGLFGKIKTPLDLMSVSIRNTVRLMEEKGLKRLIVMTAMGVGDTAGQLPGFFSLMIKYTNIKYSYADHNIQEKVIENSSLDWTIVRPVGLNDKNNNLSIRNNLVGDGKIKSMISRNAVAHFMLDCLEKGQFIRQKPGISNT